MVSENSDQGSKKSKSSNRFRLGRLFYRRPKTHSQGNITDHETGTVNAQRLTTNTAPPYTLHGPQTTGNTSNMPDPSYAPPRLSPSQSLHKLPAAHPPLQGGRVGDGGANAQGAYVEFSAEPLRRYQLLIDETGFFIRHNGPARDEHVEIFRLKFRGGRPTADALEKWVDKYLRPGFNACVDDLKAIQRLIEVWGFPRQRETAEPHLYIATVNRFVSACRSQPEEDAI